MNKLRLTGSLLTRLLGLWLACASCVQSGYAQQSGGGNYPTGNGVRVKEVDGSPNVPGTQTLVFPNGSLTRAGQTVTVTIAGGTTINSTNGQVPYRVNSTTFGDSAFASNALNSTYLSATSGASGAGLTLTVAGGGTNESLKLAAKGSGQIQIVSGDLVTYGGIWRRYNSLGSIQLMYIDSFANDLYLSNEVNGALILRTNATEVARLTSGGLFGVGVTPTTAQVEVNSQSTTRAGLKLSALTGTGASQQVFQSYNAAGVTLTYAVRADGVEFQSGVTFANLPGTPSNGMYLYCSDCTVTSGADNTATSGGSGAFVVRLNGVWRAFNAQN